MLLGTEVIACRRRRPWLSAFAGIPPTPRRVAAVRTCLRKSARPLERSGRLASGDGQLCVGAVRDIVERVRRRRADHNCACGAPAALCAARSTRALGVREMRRYLFATASLATVLLVACSSDVTFNNQSDSPVHDVRWTLQENPEVVIDVGAVAPRTSKRTTLPSGFGESSLWIGATRGSELLVAECGYIESDSSYSAAASIQAEGPIICKVNLRGY